jgi:RNA polymerase sigma-70 factor (ECF subfamily)
MGEAEDDFTAMYVAHADRVYAYLCTQLGPQDAEELTAQVFCEAWRQRTTVRLDQGWMPWLIGVARNLTRQVAKQHARRTRVEVDDEAVWGVMPDPAGTLADADEQRRQVVAALTALRGLSEADREVVQMCVIAGLSPADVATALGEPASTVRSRLTRARRRLAAATTDLLTCEELT